MPFNLFPYTNLHNLNLDWILTKVKEAVTTIERIARNLESWAARLQAVENTVDGCVQYTAQSKTSEEKSQARTNIGAASATDLQQTQETLAQVQTTANNNAGAIGGLSAEVFGLTQDVNHLNAQHYVLYSEQSLDAEDKAQARTNIGAADASLPGAVRYDMAQNNLTAAQKQIARNNIDCPPQPPRITITMTGETTGTYDVTLFNTILSCAASGYVLACYIVIPGSDPAYVPLTVAYTSTADPSAAVSSLFMLNNVVYWAMFISNGTARLYTI